MEYLQALSELSERHRIPYDIHILETKLQRVLGDEKHGKSFIRYVHDAGVLSRTDDGDPCDLGRRRGHRAPCRLRLHRRPQPHQQPEDRERRHAVPAAPLGRGPDLPRHRRGLGRRQREHVGRGQGGRTPSQDHGSGVPELADRTGASPVPDPRRGARHGPRRKGRCPRPRSGRRHHPGRSQHHRVHPSQRSAPAAPSSARTALR